MAAAPTSPTALSDSVSVIDTTTNTVTGSAIPVGSVPDTVAVTPDGSRAYVTNFLGDSVSVIDTTTNSVTGSPIPVGNLPVGVAISPDGTRAYVANLGGDSVSVIDTTTNTVTGSPIPVGDSPQQLAVTPDGTRAYVANSNSSSVSMIALQPSPPRSVSGSPGDSQVTVSWQEPSFTVGQSITAYLATASPGGNGCATAGATTCTITGLSNGTAYTVTVTATNNIGTSAPSAPSAAVTPGASITPPQPPPIQPIQQPGKVTGAKAKVRKGTAKFTWTPTTGADSYRVRISKPGGTKYKAWKTTTKTAFKATVKRGKKYQFQIAAVGTDGNGPTTTIRFKGK